MQPLTADIVTRIVERQFPELAPARVTYMGAGMDNTAFEVNSEWVFRFPMRSEVERTLDAERALLPAIAPRVELPIPVFAFHGMPDADFPMRFAGYRKVPGVPGSEVHQSSIQWNTLAEQLGRFLSAVHAFPVDEARRLGAETIAVEQWFEHVRVTSLELLPVVQRVAPDVDLERLRHYLRTLAPLPPSPFPLSLIHHDLAAEHVMLAPDGSRATGVIDWGDVAIVDPTVDFVGLHAWRGDDFVRAVLSHYEGAVDERVLERVRPWSTFRVIQDIEFGVNNDLPDVVRLAVEALTHV